jgi:hypothetical protein
MPAGCADWRETSGEGFNDNFDLPRYQQKKEEHSALPWHDLRGISWLQHFNFIRDDGHFGQLHRGVLGELFGVVGGRAPLQDQAVRQENDAKVTDTIADSPQQHPFQALFIRKHLRPK